MKHLPVVLALVALIAVLSGGVLFWSRMRTRWMEEEARRQRPMGTLEQFVVISAQYQAPNGDFFPSAPVASTLQPAPAVAPSDK